MLKFATATLAVFLMVAPAHAQQVCLTPLGIKTALTRDVPGIVIETFSGNDGREMLRLINAIPPQTSVQADELLVASNAAAPMVVIAYFKAGCMNGRLVFPVIVFNRIKNQIDKGRV